MKKARYILLCVLFLIGVMLSSCSGLVSPALTSPTTLLTIETVTPTPKVIPILFSVERMNMECVHPGEAIPIKLIFYNITTRNLRIRNAFSLSPYLRNVTPTIIDEKGDWFVDSSSLMIVDQFPTPPTPAYQEIASKGNFEIVTDYFFPERISPAPSLDWFSTPTPGPIVAAVFPKAGKYFVKFQYLSSSLLSATDEIWEGGIDSNQVEVCIQ